MISNVLKIGVGALCVYAILQGDSVDTKTEDMGYIVETDEKAEEVFSQTNVESGIAYNARNIYESLFEELRVSGVLKQEAEILDVYVNDNELVLNVNEEFIYIGGTLREAEVINRIVEIGLSFNDIKYVTILVNGNIAETSEGINIYKMKEKITI